VIRVSVVLSNVSNVSEQHVARLADERERAVALIAKLTGDFEAVVEASREVATDDEHDPEGATIAYERTQVDAVLSMTRAHLAELDLALARVQDGTFGNCLVCGRPIGEERLEAQPAATTCVACAAPRKRLLGR
jgi:DnaK suppressor protein